MLPTEAQKELEIVRKRGEKGITLNRVFRIIQNKELYLMAYAKLYANEGALTPGTDPRDTIDGMSMKKIDAIIDKLKEKKYTWTPVRRTYIEKKNSQKKRPLGIPALEDKIVQRAVTMVLNAIYEQDFLAVSYGYRAGKSANEAVGDLTFQLQYGRFGYLVEADIQGFFDNLDHEWLLTMLALRIDDKAFLNLIRKWLKAGILEPDGMVKHPDTGTPQGGIVTPLTQWTHFHFLCLFP